MTSPRNPALPGRPSSALGPAVQRSGAGVLALRPVMGNGKAAAILKDADSWIGTPYGKSDRFPQRKGAEGTGDCSGSTEAIYRAVGLPIRRGSSERSGAEALSNSPDLIERPSIQPAMPGDILYWEKNGTGPFHVAIWLGAGTFKGVVHDDLIYTARRYHEDYPDEPSRSARYSLMPFKYSRKGLPKKILHYKGLP